MFKNTLLISILFCYLFSQFNDVQVTYEHNERMIPDDKVYILEKFNSLIKDYFENTLFSSEYDYLDIPLIIHLIYEKIRFVGDYEFDQIQCQILLTNNADQYYFSKNITFPYSKGKSIYYSPSIFDPLSSFFDYYAYLFIGLELDTYDLFLGSSYYQKCLDLYSLSYNSSNSSTWRVFKENIEIIKNNEDLRKARYNFYFSIDMIGSDSIQLELIKEHMDDFLYNIKSVHDNFGYEKYTLKFINTFHIEIADLFKLLSMNEGINFLIQFDDNNKNTYINYLK